MAGSFEYPSPPNTTWLAGSLKKIEMSLCSPKKQKEDRQIHNSHTSATATALRWPEPQPVQSVTGITQSQAVLTQPSSLRFPSDLLEGFEQVPGPLRALVS